MKFIDIGASTRGVAATDPQNPWLLNPPYRHGIKSFIYLTDLVFIFRKNNLSTVIVYLIRNITEIFIFEEVANRRKPKIKS